MITGLSYLLQTILGKNQCYNLMKIKFIYRYKILLTSLIVFTDIEKQRIEYSNQQDSILYDQLRWQANWWRSLIYRRKYFLVIISERLSRLVENGTNICLSRWWFFSYSSLNIKALGRFLWYVLNNDSINLYFLCQEQDITSTKVFNSSVSAWTPVFLRSMLVHVHL